jgi:hypothetical protein
MEDVDAEAAKAVLTGMRARMPHRNPVLTAYLAPVLLLYTCSAPSVKPTNSL